MNVSPSDPQPVLVQTLEYQLPADAAASPWATVVRAVGWTAAGLSAAKLAAGLSVVAFWWGLRGSLGFDVFWVARTATGLLYLPALIGGIACARLRPHGWKLLTYSLWVLLGTKALLALMAMVSVWLDRWPSNFGVWGKVGQAGGAMSSIAGDAVPLVLLLWVLRRPGVRQLFDGPQQPLAH